MQNPPPGQTGKSSTGLEENIAALLAYILGWISGLVFLLIEKDSKLVRFHAMQSIILNVCAIVIYVVFWVISLILMVIVSQVSGALSSIVWLLSLLVFLAVGAVVVVAWVMCLIKAYQSQFFKLPVIGNFAEKFVNK